jgi:Zn-dependent metalloprotease
MIQLLKITPLSLIISATLMSFTQSVIADEIASMSVKVETSNGSPSFVTGQLGNMDHNAAVESLKAFLGNQGAYGITGNEDFTVFRDWKDDLGRHFTHFDQTINGIKVYGTSIVMQSGAQVDTQNNPNTFNTSDIILSVSGVLAVNAETNIPSMIGTNNIRNQALSAAKSIGEITVQPALSYIYLPLREETKLAYRMEVTWDNGSGDFGRDFVYYDANTGELLSREPQVHSAKSWKTYTLNGGSQRNAPGRLLCTNSQNCNNSIAQEAHDGASTVYDFYKEKFGRNSLDNRDMSMVSSVELGEPNAYWTGRQMMYGKSSNGISYTADFDVIGHEFTHGVTGSSARLVYQGASGALNEAWSDMGVDLSLTI